MTDIKTVEARLDIELFVTCPNEDCEYLIDLLREDDTDGTLHDDDAALVRQIFPEHGSHDDFECKEVTCSKCKTTFNVKGLEW
ncbi:hypothetical protein [Sedimenticola selenatireducens]|uniref:Uncharacterized protein n=1 Tax=Sedimenticola selenatireducens TaxID=191960 RepID=A0A557SCF4_9GAMM|nr:hypothetical protein [Sedimenticola selenatireducens]TVO75102.1 hypothetical protein FHP88_08805 [Sedimenticola selenatireducens]TVT67044.1 MAG: hypothetical protein FHK78_01555 [Sedimenticola selenatireducens]